jgi:hypothetical protein
MHRGAVNRSAMALCHAPSFLPPPEAQPFDMPGIVAYKRGQLNTSLPPPFRLLPAGSASVLTRAWTVRQPPGYVRGSPVVIPEDVIAAKDTRGGGVYMLAYRAARVLARSERTPRGSSGSTG